MDPKNPRETGAVGGVARAAKMTAEERSKSGRDAVKARWAHPRAQYTGTLKLGDIEIACAVLENGQRIINDTAFQRALGRADAGGQTYRRRAQGDSDLLPIYVALSSLKPFYPQDFSVPTVRYIGLMNKLSTGVDATVIPAVCSIWLAARRAGALRKQQLPTAERAEIIMNSLAVVGIIALVDEVTGYQADRARDELQTILKAYVVAEMLPWLQRFPSEFFKETYRIMGWEYKAGSAKHPGFVGTIINEWIYKRLPDPVLPELQKVNPVDEETGRRKRKHHQHLTAATGIPHLDRQIGSVTMLMRASINRRMFEELLVRAFPVVGEQLPLGIAALGPRRASPVHSATL